MKLAARPRRASSAALPAARPRPAAWPAEILAVGVRPSWPCRRRARRPARRRTGRNRPTAPAGRSPCAAACALMSAFSSKVVPVSSGSGRPSSRGRLALQAERRDQIGDLAQLAGIVAGDDDLLPSRRCIMEPPDSAARRIPANCRRDRGNRSSGRRSAIRSRLRWRCPSPAAAPSSHRSRPRTRESRDGPAARAVRRHRQRAGRRRTSVASGLKSSSTPVAAAEEDVPAVDACDGSRPEHVAIECLGRSQIGDVERGFEDGRGLHRPPCQVVTPTAIFCSATSSRDALLGQRHQRGELLFLENGSPSAVPWISTMPPLPVMTKLASVSADESST